MEKLLVKEGCFGGDAPADPDPLEVDEPLLSQLYSASVQGRVVSGPTIADAFCDRLLHNAHRIELHGPSRRQEKKKQN